MSLVAWASQRVATDLSTSDGRLGCALQLIIEIATPPHRVPVSNLRSAPPAPDGLWLGWLLEGGVDRGGVERCGVDRCGVDRGGVALDGGVAGEGEVS